MRSLQMHQGRIDVERLEQGSLFRVSIPLRT
jgi:hypothetical protein